MNKELALGYCDRTLSLKNKIEEAFLELGQRLQKIRDEQLYKGQYESFDLFCEELKMSESKASKIINIYQKFVVDYSIPEDRLLEAGGWTQLAEILPFVKDKASAEELIEMSILHPRKALRDLLMEKKTGVSQDTCSHGETYEIKICRQCGVKIKTIKE